MSTAPKTLYYVDTFHPGGLRLLACEAVEKHGDLWLQNVRVLQGPPLQSGYSGYAAWTGDSNRTRLAPHSVKIFYSAAAALDRGLEWAQQRLDAQRREVTEAEAHVATIKQLQEHV